MEVAVGPESNDVFCLSFSFWQDLIHWVVLQHMRLETEIQILAENGPHWKVLASIFHLKKNQFAAFFFPYILLQVPVACSSLRDFVLQNIFERDILVLVFTHNLV